MAVSLIRTAILYFAIILSLRIMGKRQVGELGPSELVVAVMISDLATNPMQDPGIPLLYGLLPVLLLLSIEMLLSALANRSVKFRALLSGKPSMVIENGVINQKEMRKNRFTLDDLQEALRQNSVTDISSVMSGVLEVNGAMSVLLKPEETPATVKDVGATAEVYSYPMTIICDGRLIRRNLALLGHDDKWLEKTLRKNGVRSPKEVYLLTADSTGRIFFVKKEAVG